MSPTFLTLKPFTKPTTDSPTMLLVETHFKDDLASTNNTSHTHVLPPKTLVDKIYDPKRLDEAVNTFDSDKKAWNLIKSITRSIMIRSHELQHTPSSWTDSKGIFLPKPGKIDYNHPKSFITITLSSVLLKLQERVILWRMQDSKAWNECNLECTSLILAGFGFL